MSKQQFKLNVAARASTGRSASRRLRKANQIPAILYGKHTSPETLSVDGPEFIRLLKSIGGSATLIELQRKDKEAALSFLQEVQRDPITDKYVHIDLQEVKADEKMEIRIRTTIVGDSVGVRTQGGVLETSSFYLRIRCLPKDMPSVIQVDVSDLKLGETIKVSDLKPVDGVEFLDQKNQPIVSCVQSQAEEVAETTTATAAAPAAGAAAAAAAAPAADAKGAAAKPAAAAAKPAAKK